MLNCLLIAKVSILILMAMLKLLWLKLLNFEIVVDPTMQSFQQSLQFADSEVGLTTQNFQHLKV